MTAWKRMKANVEIEYQTLENCITGLLNKS